VTQIFFDWIEADGLKWAAVIGHNTGGARFTVSGAPEGSGTRIGREGRS
jgi:hypothetical protein